jgi:hypothetical protein
VEALALFFRGQVAVLSAFVLVGMMFLVPTITEKALASIKAVVTGTCGPEGETHPCQFTLVSSKLDNGRFVVDPTPSGTSVGWKTSGNPLGGKELGTVTYKFGDYEAHFQFHNPAMNENAEINDCGVKIMKGPKEVQPWSFSSDIYPKSVPPGEPSGTCHHTGDVDLSITYTVRGANTGSLSGAQLEEESQTALQKQDCSQLKAKMANDEAAAAQYKSKDCEGLLK